MGPFGQVQQHAHHWSYDIEAKLLELENGSDGVMVGEG